MMIVQGSLRLSCLVRLLSFLAIIEVIPAARVMFSTRKLQVQVFEGLLRSYYNHTKFLSFVRQLNFYGKHT